MAKFHFKSSSIQYHNYRTLKDDHLLEPSFDLCCNHTFKMRMLQPVITMDEDQEDRMSYPVRRVNDQAWLRVISNSSYALHIQSTSYRTCLVIQLSFTFPQVVSPCLKVSIAGIMHLEINDAVNFYTSSIPKDTSCSFQAD